MISASCACGRSVRVNVELAGREVRCPGCSQPLTIPAPEPPESLDAGDDLSDQADDDWEDHNEERSVSGTRKGTSHRGVAATVRLTFKRIFGGLSMLIGGMLGALIVGVVVTGRGEIDMLRWLVMPIAMIGLGIAWVRGGTFGS